MAEQRYINAQNELGIILVKAYSELPMYLSCVESESVPKIWGLTDEQSAVIAYLRGVGYANSVVNMAIARLRESNVPARIAAY